MYGIHTSFYSIGIGIRLVNLIIISWINIWGITKTHLIILLIELALAISLIMLWIMVLNWLNDLCVESILSFTCSEQTALILGIKWLIISESMLFFASFWTLINFRIYTPAFSICSAYPQFSSYTYTIPFSNLIILLFSSLPIQASQVYVRIGFLALSMESLGQSVCCGLMFIVLQSKEFLYSYYTLTDSIIGTIFYFTTGLHGLHVIFGSFGWFIICGILIVGHSKSAICFAATA